MAGRLLALVGPTASGKTAVAVALAKRIDAELVSADAVAVYTGLDIGSAKPTADELQGIPLHGVDLAQPNVDFTVHDYEAAATGSIDAIRARGRFPLVVGGTGLYVRPLVASLALPPVPPDPAIRARLNSEAEANGPGVLHARLAAIDPESAQRIQTGDTRRIVRALEVWETTGRPMSEFHTPEGVHGIPKSGTFVVGLERPRDILYQRIDRRVDTMLDDGFIDEVRELLEAGWNPSLKSLSSLGYRHLIQYLVGEKSLAEAVDELKRDTRRYAKRQIAWFRNDPSVHWIGVDNDEDPESVAQRIEALWRNSTEQGTGTP
ncbi:MAG: tRNA (adenosine(37)-N6)-dimethylallyltransferase MiaA [Armatimonadaceae bacterium]